MPALESCPAPGPQDIREATPAGRLPYITARKAIDFATAVAVEKGPAGRDIVDAVPKIRSAYAELCSAMIARTLEPPIDTNSDVGALVADFDDFYLHIDGKRQPTEAEINNSLDALYTITDHGSRRSILSERFDKAAHARAHQDPGFIGQQNLHSVRTSQRGSER